VSKWATWCATVAAAACAWLACLAAVRSRVRVMRFTSAAACAWLACLAAAAAPPERAIDESHRGYIYYREYCASCHGLFADGLGPVVPALRNRPPDLASLALKYGHPLPKAELIEIIDGRNMVRGHGHSDMPVWGNRMYETVPPNATRESVRRQTMLLIVEYLEAIQRPLPED